LMKMPEPMIPLTTIIVASSGPSLRASGTRRAYAGSGLALEVRSRISSGVGVEVVAPEICRPCHNPQGFRR
jgi:hypothetical protein